MMKRFYKWTVYTLIPFILLSITGEGIAQTISGEITSDEVWSGTAKLTGDVTIAKGSRVVITPGTRVLFAAKSDDKKPGTDTGRIELIVAGTLIAEGTTGQIVFTSASDTPASGDWRGISITGDASFNNCVIEYADVGVTVKSAGTDIKQVTAQNNLKAGLSLEKQMSISDSTFRNNGAEGIVSTTIITVKNCVFLNNQAKGLNGSSEVYAEGCTFKENQASGVWGLKIRFKDSITESNKGDGITCQTDATIIKSQIFSNAGDGVYAPNGKVNCTDSAIYENGSNGIYSTSLTVMNSNFYRNGQSGISFRTVDSVGIKGNTITQNKVGVKLRSSADFLEFPGGNDIYSNTDYELANGNRVSITTKGNYWGDTTTTELKSKVTNLTKIYDAIDNSMVGTVTISDYSTARLNSFVPPAAGSTPTPTLAPTSTTPSPTAERTPTPEGNTPSPTTTATLNPSITPSFTPTLTITKTPTVVLSPSPTSIPLEGLINSGETKYVEITEAAEDKIFRFPGEQNQTASLLISKVTGTIVPQLELHDPRGEPVTIIQATEPVFIPSVTLPKTGVYTLRCRDQKGVNRGTFGLSFILSPGQVVSAQDMDGGRIHSGEVKSGFEDIADLDGFTFNALAGNTVFILMAKRNGNLFPAFTLLDPNGNPVQSVSGSDSAEMANFHLPFNGTYLILCRDAAGLNSGQYALSFRLLETTNTCTRGDMNSDGNITPGDAQSAFTLFADITKGNKKPLLPFTYCDEFWKADYNEDSAITPLDAQAIFERFIASLDAKITTGKIFHSQRVLPESNSTVMAGSLSAEPSDLITIPIYYKNTKNLSALSFSLEYDPDLAEYLDIKKDGTLVEPFSSLAAVPLKDKVVVSGYAGSATLDFTRNILINLSFRIRASALSTTTNVVPCDFLDDLYGAEAVSGKITIQSTETLTPEIQVGHVNGYSHQEVRIPISVHNANGIKSFAFNVEADTAMLRFKNILRKDTLTENFYSIEAILNAKGGITVAGYAGNNKSIQTEGVFLYLVYIIQDVQRSEIPVTITNLLDDLSLFDIQPGGISMQTSVWDWELF